MKINKNWLHEHFIVLNYSTTEIGKMLGLSRAAIYQQLKKHQIPTKSRAECQRPKINDTFICNESVITGCLLGDASLSKSNSNGNARLRKTNKNKDHVEYVAKLLFSNGGKVTPETRKYKNKILTYYKFCTQRYPELTELFTKWYPDGKKIIPDINLNPTVLLHWYLDDGCCHLVNKVYPFIQFCSESFTESDQLKICDQINSLYNLNAGLSSCQWGTKYRIRITSKKSNDFLNLIGPPPVASLSHKWKYKL